MKNTILIFTSIFLLLTSFHFKKASKQDIEVNAVISADKVNVFYIGVDNPISVAISDVPIEETKVSIDKGSITPRNKQGEYNVRVFETGIVTVFLEGKDRQGNRVESSSEFRVKRVPDPVAKLGRKSGHPVGNYDNTIGRGLLAVLQDFDFDIRFQVVSYEVQFTRKGIQVKTYFNEGSLFSPEILKVSNNALVGDIFYFDKILVMESDGYTHELTPISFQIKE